MRCTPLVTLAAAITLIALIDTQRPHAQSEPDERYWIDDVSGPGTGASFADAIDPLGNVVGVTVDGGERAFQFKSGEGVHLDAIAATLGGPRSFASGANYGLVTGSSNPAGNANFRGFIYNGTRVRDIGTLGGAQTLPQDINGSGWVAGVSSLANGDQHAFLFNGASLLDLGTFGGRNSYGYAVNEAGWVTGGASSTGSTALHAFLFDGSSMRDLGTLGGQQSVGRAIDGEGRVVGTAQTSAGADRAFLHDGTTIRDLGTLGGPSSAAFDINDRGEIVGETTTATGATRAFVYRDGRMIDLNSFIDPASGWTLRSATSINNAGQIAGNGTLRGVTRAFRLTPPQAIGALPIGIISDAVSNFPNPIQTGGTIGYAIGLFNEKEAAVRVTTTSTFTGPVEVVRAEIYSGPPCDIAGQVVTCHVDGVGDGTNRELRIFVRTLQPGPFSHRARIDALGKAFDMEPEHNTAVSLSTAEITPGVVAGGKSTSLRVHLTSPAPSSDARVALTSSNPAVVPVPPTLDVISGGTTRVASLTPRVVAEPTRVELTARYGLVTRTVTLTVVPPAVSTLTLAPTTAIGGCASVGTKVSLTGAAPAAGASVLISEALPAARFPASIVVPPGATSQSLTVATDYVTDYQSGAVTASYGGASRSVTLTIRPIRARSHQLSPNPAAGGTLVKGTIALECVSRQPVLVTLSTSNAAVAAPVVSTVTIPAGAQSATFDVRTFRPSVTTSVNIDARVHRALARAVLSVRP
jgi:probable HAF family extracellular repeat protein